MNQASTLPSIGDRVDGKFRIERKLGEGGTSTVFAVRHTITDKQFAIKWLSPELAKNELAVERFVHEAKICGRYAHPNAVEIYDICRTQESIYLLMELLEGESLETRLKRVGRFSVRDACDILLPCIDALGAAHELGIVHRDLKPSNIFLCSIDGRAREMPKVLDFGISKLSRNGHDMSPVTTTTRTVIGTPHYMAPEQMRGHPADPRFDVYALGVVLYELVAGQPPFQSDTFADLVFRILEAQSLPLDHVAQTEPEFADIVARAMARDAWDRFPGMAELACALRPYASQLPAAAFESPSSPGFEVTSTGVRCSPSLDGVELPPPAMHGPAPADEAAATSVFVAKPGSFAALGSAPPSVPGDDRGPRAGSRTPSVVAAAARGALGPPLERRAAPTVARGGPVVQRELRGGPVMQRELRRASVAPRAHGQPSANARASAPPPAAVSAQAGSAPAIVPAAAPLGAASALGAKAAGAEVEVREVTETSGVIESSTSIRARSTPVLSLERPRGTSKRVVALWIGLGVIGLGLVWQLRQQPAHDPIASQPVKLEPIVLRSRASAPSHPSQAEPSATVTLAAAMEPVPPRAAPDSGAKRAPARATTSARRPARAEPARPPAAGKVVAATSGSEPKPRIERQDFEDTRRGLTLPATDISRQDF